MNKYRKREIWLALVVLILFVAGFAEAAPAGKYQKIADSLSVRMRSDLSDSNLRVEINRAANMRLSEDRENLFGDAHVLLGDGTEKAHIYFEAIVDTEENEVAMVDYTFVEDSDLNRNFLEKLVIKQLGSDHRTDDVVLTLEDIYRVEENGAVAEKFRGVGEVRIGGFVWKQVRFEVTLGNDSEKVLYQLKDM